MTRAPLDIPGHLQWLDDAARAVYEAAHRFADGNGHNPDIPWGHRGSEEGPYGSPRSWEQVRAVYPGWCFHAAMALALCKPTREQAIDVSVWAWEQARASGVEPAARHQRFGIHAFTALAEEADLRLARAS